MSAKIPTPRDVEKTRDMVSNLIEDLRIAWRLFSDPRVPFFAKIIPFLALLYVISPIDVLPDFIVGLGQLDDLAIIVLGVKAFVSVSPAALVAEHRRAIRGSGGVTDSSEDEEVINAEYRVMHDD